MCDRFYERYKEELASYDAFIVTHTPVFALLYEKWGKPVIVVNSARYEHSHIRDPAKLEWLNEGLRRGVKEKRIHLISNNKGDQANLKYFTGLSSEHIPSLCLYTNGQYTGKNSGFFCKWSLAHVLQEALNNPELIQNRKLQNGYQWQELYDLQGIIHVPYQISTMSLFEQYSANVPLFFPSKPFLRTLHREYPRHVLEQLSFFTIFGLTPPATPGNPNNVNDPAVVDAWIDAADFYDTEAMPHIQYFDSFVHLEQLLTTIDLHKISQKMQAHNVGRKKQVIDRWNTLLSQLNANR